MPSDSLLVELQDGILKLTINRPTKRNALSLALLDQIGDTFVTHGHNDNVKCAVITATDDKAFAAGGDLKELDAIRSNEDAKAMSKRGRTALDHIRNFPLPVIAGLNGLALGGGAELAMACDLRVAAAHAEIGFLQSQLNVTTAWGGGIDLIAGIGHQRALDLLLSARRIPATEALNLGLVHYLCRDTESLTEGLATFLTPYLQRSTQVLRGFKALAASQRQSAHERLAGLEQANFITAWTSDEHWAAVDRATAERANRKSRS
jgi:enoyl-CoA hydratase